MDLRKEFEKDHSIPAKLTNLPNERHYSPEYVEWLEQRLKAGQHETLIMRSDDAEYMTISTPSNIYWKPKKDITTYELAKAMDILLYMASGGDTWSAEGLISEAPENVKRHFSIEPNA